MKNFWSFAIFVALVAILFTLNDGLYEKTKTFFSNLIGGISIETPAFDATIEDDAEWETYASGPCGFSVDLPDSFAIIEQNACSGVIGEAQLVLSAAATTVCESLVKKGKDTSSCHLHTFEIANGPLESEGDAPTIVPFGILEGTQTITPGEDVVTIEIVAKSPKGRSYRYTHVAPVDQEDTAIDNFKKILATYTHNS